MNFQEELYQLVQKCKETINPFTTSEEDAGSDIQLVVEFANKWDFKSKYDDTIKKLEELTTRVDKDKQEASVRGIMSVVKDVLPALDDANQVRSYLKDSNLQIGIDSLISNLEKILLSRNGSVINPQTGDKFDPSLHTAITAETVKSDPKNPCIPGSYVYQTLRRGYVVLSKVIRHAEVKVLIVN